MTDSEKIDLLLQEMLSMKTDISTMKVDMSTMKAELSIHERKRVFLYR